MGGKQGHDKIFLKDHFGCQVETNWKTVAKCSSPGER